MLGVRAKWLKGGREAAEDAFKKFRNLIAYSIKETAKKDLNFEIIETDAVALICSDVSIALKIAKRLYLGSFYQTLDNKENKPWFRGVIVHCKKNVNLRSMTKFSRPLDQVQIMLYDSDLLDAISIEKSGVKGMRIIVDKNLITDEVNNQFMARLRFMNLFPLRDSKIVFIQAKLVKGI